MVTCVCDGCLFAYHKVKYTGYKCLSPAVTCGINWRKGDHKVPIVSALQDESLGQITAVVGGMVSGLHKDTAFVTCEL